jgi:hypothetical protein
MDLGSIAPALARCSDKQANPPNRAFQRTAYSDGIQNGFTAFCETVGLLVDSALWFCKDEVRQTHIEHGSGRGSDVSRVFGSDKNNGNIFNGHIPNLEQIQSADHPIQNRTDGKIGIIARI